MYACLYETVSHYLSRSGVQNWLFWLKFEGSFGWNDAVGTTRVLHMLPEALPIIHIHLTKVRNHSSSNGCLSLHLNVTFARLNWCPKLVILLENWRFVSKNNTVMTIRLYDMLSQTLPIILIGLEEIRKHSSSNGCLSLQHWIIIPEVILCPKLCILLEIWAIIW